MTETTRTRKQFWEQFRNRIRLEDTQLTPTRELNGRHFMRTDIPVNGFHVNFHAYKQPEEHINYVLNVQDPGKYWHTIKNNRSEIRQILDEPVKFAGPKYDNSSQQHTIRVRRDESIFDNKESWDKYHGWFINGGEKSIEVAQKIIDNCDQ